MRACVRVAVVVVVAVSANVLLVFLKEIFSLLFS